MEKKKLYIAQNLDGLKSQYQIEPSVLHRTLPQLLTSLKKLEEEAEKCRLGGDEEKSYIFYMKYMNLLSKLQKLPDFGQEKALVTKMIGNNETIDKLFNKLEQLQNSLKGRYEREYPTTLPLAESTRLSENIEVPAKVSTPEVREVIDCKTLFDMIEDKEKVLILDCRSEEHFEASRMNFMFTTNVPENLLVIGMTASKIQERLPNESRVFWEMRKQRPFLIFVDWNSSRFNRNSPVWHLREILTEWDQDMEKKPEMLLLEGGYEKWKTLYPMKCHNPQFQQPITANGEPPSIGDIEYPHWEDIQMKDTSLNKTQGPQFDRSMKPNGVKHDASKSQLQLLEENEKILDKSLQNEKALLELETSFKKVVTDKENCEDSANKERNYLFQIWQLQAKQQDFKMEENSIKEQLEQTKEVVKEPQEVTKLMQVEQHLLEMNQERIRLNEEREAKKREREEALKIARDRKPTNIDHRTPIKAQRKEEIILSPKALSNQVITPTIPSFDRSSKPLQSVNRQIFNEQDFSPVYGRVERGLTGLKNLGNSCYMNSIIQCLSNTSTLTSYLLENNYEKHVNRSNKTKGHIVRTLAAVIKMLWNGECKYISSKHLKAAIGELDNLFYGVEQQDSHEFLIMLIDWLQSDLQTIPVQNAIGSIPSEKAWLEYTKAKESFILRLFYGQIKSTVKCMVCSRESATYETFSNLSLELPPNNIDRCHINDCFNLYFHGEIVVGWNCPFCKQPRDAIKKLDISKLPPVLVIHLKRFYAEPYMNSTFRKKTIYVDFPLTAMDMLPYVARTEKNNGSNSQHIYNLYAVSNHYGSMESGHYTAFCRNAQQKKWYKFDDQTVSPLDRTEVKSSAAYILFYTSSPDPNNCGSR